jgi:hypothetical protein
MQLSGQSLHPCNVLPCSTDVSGTSRVESRPSIDVASRCVSFLRLVYLSLQHAHRVLDLVGDILDPCQRLDALV